MGAAIQALPKGVKNVMQNPVLIGISIAAMVAMIPLLVVGGIVALVLSLVPIVGQLAARVLVAVPLKVLLLGGLVGAAGKGFRGDLSFGDYLTVVKENARSLGGAYAIYEGGIFILGLALGVVMLFVVFGGSLAMGAMTDPGTMAGFGAGMIVLYLIAIALFLAVAVVFQFLDVAVVLGDHDATGAFGESWRLVRDAPLSVLGYTLLRGLLGFAIVLPGILITVAATQVADALAVVGGVVTLLLYPVAFAVVMSYHAAYYGVRLQAP